MLLASLSDLGFITQSIHRRVCVCVPKHKEADGSGDWHGVGASC